MIKDEAQIPTHVGFIVDGNRRWAAENNQSANQGHRRGYKNLKTITRAAFEHGVQYVSAYVFSSENWNRDKQEVKDIMKLLIWALNHEVKNFHKENIKIRFIGTRVRLGKAVLAAIQDAERLTEKNTRGTLLICLDYGGQQEIVDAVKKIVESGVNPKAVTKEAVEQNLYAPDVPNPDLIIRTSGEQRLSNFLTWQSVYSELIFIEKFWPDFTEDDLSKAFQEYASRKRRFGK